MNPKESIETIKTAIEEIEWNYPMEYAAALDEAVKALEKQIPKRVVRRIVNRGFNLPMPTWVNVCPCCGIDTPNPRDLEIWESWCPDCGQALKWE